MKTPLLADGSGATFWLPEAASSFAAAHDYLYYLIFWISTFFFIAMMAAMVYFMVKYRRRKQGETTSDIHGNTTLEIAWSVIPALILAVFFVLGFRGFIDTLTPPANTLNINVTGQQWSWSFTYPNGGNDSTLVVPVGKPVKLTMTSVDVIHSFFVPAFRAKRDVVPGRYTILWFQSDKLGEYDVLCTEYCGTNHSLMLSKVKVVSQEEYDAHLKGLTGCQDGQSLAECGAVAFKRNGCNSCHSAEGCVRHRAAHHGRSGGHRGRAVHPRVGDEPDGQDCSGLPRGDAGLRGPHQRGADGCTRRVHPLHQVV
jgi:cytochrome c oxidase subunit II